MISHRNRANRKPLQAFIIIVAILGAFSGPAPRSVLIAKEPPPDLRGANVIIPNIDDDDGDGLPDAAVDVLSGALEDDLLRIVLTLPASLPDDAMLRAEVEKPWASVCRVLLRDPSDDVFRALKSPEGIGRDEARGKEIMIGIETSDFADEGRPPAFGLKVRFETKDGRLLSEETIRCRVAPFMMSCCLDPVADIHVVRTKLTESFVADLGPLVEAAGAGLKAFADPAVPEHDIWIQDATEIGYASDGEHVMSVAFHGNRGRKLDGLLARALLGKDGGVIRKGGYRGREAEWIDWFGNLEASPPVRVGGRDYPNGRIYAGTQRVRAMHPDVIRFLEAQGMQAPVLWLDTSWLVIGHVDEMVSWVPSRVGSPYRMLVPSPRLALEILAQAEKDAPGGLLNRGTKRDGDAPGENERPVAEALNDKTLRSVQEFAQGKIDGVRRVLIEELGIAEADIIEIPVLFNQSSDRFAGRCDAWTPNMVNSLLVGTTFIVPDPHGPLVNGKDVLFEAVKDRLEPIGCKVVAIDNYYPYHRWGGEVHCGTNATRKPPRPPVSYSYFRLSAGLARAALMT